MNEGTIVQGAEELAEPERPYVLVLSCSHTARSESAVSTEHHCDTCGHAVPVSGHYAVPA